LFLLAEKFREKHRYCASKTKLIKLAYLAEVFYTRLQKEKLTEARWVFWHYGPYLMEYNTILESDAFEVDKTEDDFHPVNPSKKYHPSKSSIITEIAVSKAMEFSELELNKILDFVYFDTEPMMKAKSRGEELDFSCVLPESDYKIISLNLSKESKKEIENRLEEWKRKHG
jgi:uncharacterized phage-associated protein